jgi:hypothetical protein
MVTGRGWTWKVENWAGHLLERMIHETGVTHTILFQY